ncbi:MAG: thermonuclease family protein [Thermoguttaceae bacterium]|nr:thermonuclease family protein [Thermoguttaceae bacterium]
MEIFYRIGRKLRNMYPWICLFVVLVMIASYLYKQLTLPNEEPNLKEGVYNVERVIDGDTILLSGGIRVRLMGIDTPETVKPRSEVEPFGPEATAFTKQAIAQNGNRVFIRLDCDRFDKYGRNLAFVYLGESDGEGVVLLNEELVRAGLAKAIMTFNYSMSIKRRLYKAQKEAIENRRGIWSLPENQNEKPLLQKFEE